MTINIDIFSFMIFSFLFFVIVTVKIHINCMNKIKYLTEQLFDLQNIIQYGRINNELIESIDNKINILILNILNTNNINIKLDNLSNNYKSDLIVISEKIDILLYEYKCFKKHQYPKLIKN